MNIQAGIQESVAYLSSPIAIAALKADPYWPKWNSPWWHMLLLHEIGETRQIPRIAIEKYVAALNAMPLKIFPILPEEMPEGVDPYRGSMCHCQLGNVYQVLAKWGLNVDEELPWIRPWLLRYQMADGGMSCDNSAYLVKGESPSSMVGTIATFEAILLYTPRAFTPEEAMFTDRAVQFLIGRKLMLGSTTQHNAEEEASAHEWRKLCFPRFYFYDILRGLNALTAWSEKTGNAIPPGAVDSAINYISAHFPDGKIIMERQCFEGTNTLSQAPSGEWLRSQPASFFPLLKSVSAIGQISPYLSLEWSKITDRLSQQKKGRR
jgi:hypothetical protein